MANEDKILSIWGKESSR